MSAVSQSRIERYRANSTFSAGVKQVFWCYRYNCRRILNMINCSLFAKTRILSWTGKLHTKLLLKPNGMFYLQFLNSTSVQCQVMFNLKKWFYMFESIEGLQTKQVVIMLPFLKHRYYRLVPCNMWADDIPMRLFSSNSWPWDCQYRDYSKLLSQKFLKSSI